MMTKDVGLVFDIKRFALHDGPGTRTTVFLKGCPLHCLWCHNPEGISPDPLLIYYQNRCIQCGACVEVCPEHVLIFNNHHVVRTNECSLCGKCIETCTTGAWELAGSRMTCLDILQTIRQDTLFYEESGGGITFSGGEPFQQIAFLEECQKLIKCEGYHIALDTSGYAPFESFMRVLPYTDLVLFDIKMINEQKHFENTGIPNQLILSNFSKLSSMNTRIIVRVPVIPGINDSLEEITSIGRFVQENSRVQRIDLLPYHRMAGEKYKRLDQPYKLCNLSNLTHQEIEPLRQSLLQMGFESVTGG